MHLSEKIRFQRAVELAEIQEGDRILDLGCGKTYNLLRFIDHRSIGYYCGIDMEIEDSFYEKYELIKWNLENGLSQKVKEKEFDVIFLLEVLEHIENFKTLLKECREILSDKGRIIISTPSANRIVYGDIFDGIGEDMNHIHCFKKSNMRNLARKCGLKVTKIVGTYVRFPPFFRKYIVIPTKQTFYNEVLVYRLDVDDRNFLE